jgi:hypothetical protein
MNTPTSPLPRRQRGVFVVEFALVSLLFFTLLFGIFEFARMLFVYNSLQEVTRRAAREATVRWTSDADLATIKQLALFGGSALPGGAEVTTANITITYYNANNTVASPSPSDAGDNLSACGDATRTGSCIDSVEVTIDNVTYSPIFSLFGFLNLTLPASTVRMHAESMGFSAY